MLPALLCSIFILMTLVLFLEQDLINQFSSNQHSLHRLITNKTVRTKSYHSLHLRLSSKSQGLIQAYPQGSSYAMHSQSSDKLNIFLSNTKLWWRPRHVRILRPQLHYTGCLNQSLGFCQTQQPDSSFIWLRIALSQTFPHKCLAKPNISVSVAPKMQDEKGL